MENTRLGLFSKFYTNDGTYAVPAWVEIDLISDLAVAGAYDEGDSSARRAQVKTQEPTLLDLGLTGRVRVDHTDAGYNNLRDAFIAKETLDVLVLNGKHTINGSLGYRFDAKVFAMGEDQALANVIFNDLSIKPCASVNDPKAVRVTGGIPVFTDIAPEPVS